MSTHPLNVMLQWGHSSVSTPCDGNATLLITRNGCIDVRDEVCERDAEALTGPGLTTNIWRHSYAAAWCPLVMVCTYVWTIMISLMPPLYVTSTPLLNAQTCKITKVTFQSLISGGCGLRQGSLWEWCIWQIQVTPKEGKSSCSNLVKDSTIIISNCYKRDLGREPFCI